MTDDRAGAGPAGGGLALLERLGPPLAGLGRPAARQMDVLARIAARGWRPAPAGSGLPDGVEAARWHADFITSTSVDLGEAVVEMARRCAAAREAAAVPGRKVLVHGDVHNLNLLRAPGRGVRLVDPSGLASEPAHDLGVIQARGVPDRVARLAGSEPWRARASVARGCRHAGRLTGVDPVGIWQWAFLETVSTGLVLRVDRRADAETFLALAGKLAGVIRGGSRRR